MWNVRTSRFQAVARRDLCLRPNREEAVSQKKKTPFPGRQGRRPGSALPLLGHILLHGRYGGTTPLFRTFSRIDKNTQCFSLQCLGIRVLRHHVFLLFIILFLPLFFRLLRVLVFRFSYSYIVYICFCVFLLFIVAYFLLFDFRVFICSCSCVSFLYRAYGS